MGSLILCHRKKAKHPYYIARINTRIYTFEELCYFLSHNIYLIDDTMINEHLCEWVRKELELESLADILWTQMEQHVPVETFIMSILSYGSIYTAAEITKLQQMLEELKNQKDVERKKKKADNLLENNAVAQAIGIYRTILNAEWDETVERKFYGQVYANLGAAYGRLFLYKEAAYMYKKAFEICENTFMLQAYLYACRQYMEANDYQGLLMRSAVLQKLDEQIRIQMEQVKGESQSQLAEELIEEWKEQYRKIAF